MKAKKKESIADLAGLDNIGKDVDKVVIPERQKKLGRPLSLHRTEGGKDPQLTVRLPEEVHLRLKYASAKSKKSMSDITVEALLSHLGKYGV